MVADSLKNEEGNIYFEDRITGTLSEPKFVDPFAALGTVLTNQLQNNIKKLIELPGAVGDTVESTLEKGKKSLEDTTDKLKGLIPGLKK